MNTNANEKKKILKKHIPFLATEICTILTDHDCDSVDEAIPWILSKWKEIEEDFLQSNEDKKILKRERNWIINSQNHDLIMQCKEKSERRKIIDSRTNDELFINVNDLYFLIEKSSAIIISRAKENNLKYKFVVIEPWVSEHVRVFFEDRDAVYDRGILMDEVDPDAGIVVDSLEEAFLLARKFICQVFTAKYELSTYPTISRIKYLDKQKNKKDAQDFFKKNKSKLETLFYI